MKLVGEEDGNEGVVHTPDHADPKKAEAEQKCFAVVEAHGFTTP
jgi:hypothetical protein